MLITPRYYQQEAITADLDFLNSQASGHPLIAMPTGTGKSVVIGGIIEQSMAAYPDLRSIVVTHSQELVEQNHQKLIDMWPLAPAGICSAGLGRRDFGYQVTFGGIGTVYKHASQFGHINHVIVDECHMVGVKQDAMYRKFMNDLTAINPHLRVSGLSATIFRMGLGMLTEGDLFTDVCYDITGFAAFNRLVDEGYLAPLITKQTEQQLDVSSVSVSNTGEYNLKELQNAVDQDHITRKALMEMVSYGHDRKAWLVFSSGVHHALRCAAILNEMGIPTGVVHGDMSGEERRATIQAFKAGRFRCIVNNNVLTTGFDHPAIDLIACLRPTKSSGLWVQMLGRGTRPWAGKLNCLVLDFAGNAEKLGPINDPIIPKKKRKRGGAEPQAPVTVCVHCKTINHISYRFCAGCNEELPRNTAGISLFATAGTAEVMKTTDTQQVEVFDVNNVTYEPWDSRRDGEGPTMCVTYWCGLRRFKEWVPFNRPKGKGIVLKWWKDRMRAKFNVSKDDYLWQCPPVPDDLNEVLQFSHALPMPKRIRVWYNKRPHPEVLSHEFE